MKRYRLLVFFGIAVVLGMVTSLLVFSWLQNEKNRLMAAPIPLNKTVPVLVAQAGLPHLLEERGTLATHVVAEAQRGGRLFQQAPQHLLALRELRLPQVPAVEVQQVEDEVHERSPSFAAALERLEARRAVRQHCRHLAVEQRGSRRQPADGASDLRELLRRVLAVAGDEPHLAFLDPRDDPVAVVLDLVQPLVAVRRRLDDGREGQLLGPGKRPANGACEVCEAEAYAGLSLGGNAGIHLAGGAHCLRMSKEGIRSCSVFTKIRKQRGLTRNSFCYREPINPIYSTEEILY